MGNCDRYHDELLTLEELIVEGSSLPVELEVTTPDSPVEAIEIPE